MRFKVLIPVLIIIAAVLGGVLRVFLHALTFPYCWRCGSGVRRSLYVSPADRWLKPVFLVPYRCKGCLTRFYGISWRDEPCLQSVGEVISAEPRNRWNRPG